MTERGRLIVFEGADEVGKTTLAQATVIALRQSGVNVVALAFPGTEPGTLGAHIYRLHHAPKDFGVEHLSSDAIQLLHIASHLESLTRTILPALKAGKTVVLDRFWWSTLVYGTVSNADPATLKEMISIEKARWGRFLPTVVFLVRRGAPLTTVENFSAWKQIQKEYIKLGEQEESQYPVIAIHNEGDLSVAVSQIEKTLAISEKKHIPAQAKQEISNKMPIDIRVSLSPVKPTEVYNTYWRFAAERQAIFFRKIKSPLSIWTRDPILAEHKFTNAYRASDRVSQYLIRRVAYSGDQSPEELFFRIILFKTFNRISTWELLLQQTGGVCFETYNFTVYDNILSAAMDAKRQIYSAAYIMTSGRSSFGFERKHRNHLHLIELMMRDDVPRRIAEAKSMRHVFELLLSYPTMGPFLAYQYTIDLNYSSLTSFDEMDFVVPGPGALDGIRKCFSDFGGLNESDIIRLVTERQQVEFDRLNISFPSLWGRPLQLIDCQNLFCEVDKYARVKHPEFSGLTGRTRIKQKYRSTPEPIEYWYPPRWGLNERIEKGVPDVPSI